MRRTTILASLTALLLVFSLGIILNCASDDDDDDDNDDNDDAAGNRGITAYVRDFQSKQEVQGALVELIDNSTGEPIGGDWAMTSPSGGKVSFSDIPAEYGDLIGVKVSKAGNKDTYQFDFVVGATDEEFLLVGETTAELVAIILGVTLDPTAGFAAGGIYWGDPTDENPVGCAVVQTDPVPADGIYYFGADNLPLPGRNVPGDDPDNAADGLGVNPQNGYWVGMNIPPGSVDITATSGSNVETSLIPRVFPDSVCIANVYFSKDDYTSDPTESWCTE
jgi:hypothetical protein